MKEDTKPNESFVRWQAITLSQLSYSINLILTFSVAALGFGVTLALNDGFEPEEGGLAILALSLLLLLASGAFGIWGTINRLRDFRATTAITRMRDNNEKQEETQKLRALARGLGRRTWGIFWWQIGTFSAGILLMVLSVGLTLGLELLS